MGNQYKGKLVTLDRIVSAPAFRQGVKHYRRGIAPIFDMPHMLAGSGIINNMWSYERGRMFAAYAEGVGVALDETKFFINRKLKSEVRELAHNAHSADVFR
jgi:hypothetical protein